MENDLKDNRWRSRALHFFLIAAVLEGMAVLFYLLRIPGDPSNDWLLGMSKTRLALTLGLLMGIFIFGFVETKIWRDANWTRQLLSRNRAIFKHNLVYYPTVVILILVGLISSHLVWLSTVLTDEFILGYLSRLMPVILWVGLLCWQSIFLLPALRYHESIEWLPSQKLVFRISVVVFIILLILWAIIAVTGFGTVPDANGWDSPGAPVLPYQVWLAWLFAVFFFIIEGLIARATGDQNRYHKWIDIGISLLLYIITVWIWTNQPMERAYYAPLPRAPNYELYPYSDAAMYDSGAQRLLLGEGFSGITRKPLYVVMLVLFHAIAGNDYEAVVNLQVLVLATIPVIVYWMAKTLHARISGVIAAFLLILREINAIALSADIRIVHSKILMSDMPVGLGLALFTWLFITWLQDPLKRRLHPLLLGGVFGLSMLIRSNSVIMLAAIMAILIVIFYRRPLNGLLSIVLFFLGLSLTIAPWMLRSYQLTGRASFNDPSQVAFHAELYTHEVGSLSLPVLPGESAKEYIDRLNKHVVDFTLENPGVVAGFVIPHVLNNQIGMLLNLPMTPWLVQSPNTILFNYQLGDSSRLWEECCSAKNYVDQMPFWERGWYERLAGEMIIMLAVNLLMIAIGLSVAWVKWDIVGWIPLAMSLAYSLSTAAARFSGWRFALPVDWVTYMYFAIGVGQLTLWAFSYLSRVDVFEKAFPPAQGTWKRIDRSGNGLPKTFQPVLFVSVFLLIVGCLPLIVEQSVKQQYSQLTQNEGLALLEEAGIHAKITWMDKQEFQNYLQSDQAVILQGKAFYPRYYLAGEGEAGASWEAYAPRDYDRLGFSLIGPGEVQVVMALDDPPGYLPNAADVLLVGCEVDNILDALAVYVRDGSGHILVRSPQADLTCPDNE